MKLQVQGQSVRVRLTEDELESLFVTGRCCDVTDFGPLGRWQRLVILVPSTMGGIAVDGETCSLQIPRVAFEAFAGQRPRRDGFSLPAAESAGLNITIEVDVRDSRKRLSRSPSGSSQI